MDRSIEKTLEKTRKLKAKGHYLKAQGLVGDALAENTKNAVLQAEALNLSFLTESWSGSLKILIEGLKDFSLGELCGNENREAFIRCVHENAGFVTALSEHLFKSQDYEGIADWVQLSDLADQRWLANIWLKAGKETGDRDKQAMLQSAAGVALFLMQDWDTAWEEWSGALKLQPKLLKRIMGFCQRENRLDTRKLSHRLRLIKLIAAAGKKSETLSLLKALGLENHENALKVLNELPMVLPDDLESVEVATLRFNLALLLQDGEILNSVTRSMKKLSADDLFKFKKLAMLKISDPSTRRNVLLNFARIYMETDQWETAGQLLESLYGEKPHLDIVNMMEEVLDNYPIMSKLHFLAGTFYLQNEDHKKALKHLGTIQQIHEFSEDIRVLLEDYLTTSFEPALGELLLGLLNPVSHRAGLMAFHILNTDEKQLEKHLSLWGVPLFKQQASPFWYLGLIISFCKLGKYGDAYPYLCQFIRNFPDLSPEVVRSAELTGKEFRTDFIEIIRAIEDRLDKLRPHKAWVSLRFQFIDANQQYKESKLQKGPTAKPKPKPVTALPLMDSEDSADLKKQTERFKVLLDQGKWKDAAELTLKIVDDFPQSTPQVLKYLENLLKQDPTEIIWTKAILQILLHSYNFNKAIDFGRQTINSHNFQSDLPELYQLLALAYEGAGNQGEALRFFCLCSRNRRFYQENRERFPTLVLPKFPQFLKDVMQLAHINEDQETWEKLMRAWYQFRPDDIELLLKAQLAFTNQLRSTRSILDLAFWYLQAGKIEEIGQTLNRIDLRDPEILESLVNIANLVNLKYPDDPKPKFLLAKYYLLHQNVGKAVDTFRNLAQQIPNAAEAIYHYLRTFLKKNPDGIDTQRLYGLLIRFALDYGSPLASVKLLDEFGRQNLKGANALADGVYRVILEKEDGLEAKFEFLRLMKKWAAHERFLVTHETGNFGSHMSKQRLQWLVEIKELGQFGERVDLAIATLYFEMTEFDACRQSLLEIESDAFRRKAQSLYERLAERFPEDLNLLREAGWAAFPQAPEQCRAYFEKVFMAEELPLRAEAYGMLMELGESPSLQQLAEDQENQEELFQILNRVYNRVRLSEFDYYKNGEEEIPERVFMWFIHTGQLEHYHDLITRIEELTPDRKALLDAALLQAKGQLGPAAWRLSGSQVPLEVQQSAFAQAELVERAVLTNEPGSRLPNYLRTLYPTGGNRPHLIQAQVSHIKALMANGPESTTTEAEKGELCHG